MRTRITPGGTSPTTRGSAVTCTSSISAGSDWSRVAPGRVVVVLLIVAVAVCHPVFAARVPSGHGEAVWRDPGEVETLDLPNGPGGPFGRPQPPFPFVDENLLGSTAEIRIVDANHVSWMVKVGEEVRPQRFGSRLAWAVGYFSLPTFFISGTHQRRAAS